MNFADFTGNRTSDIVLTQEMNGIEYPWAGMAALGRELYTLALSEKKVQPLLAHDLGVNFTFSDERAVSWGR